MEIENYDFDCPTCPKCGSDDYTTDEVLPEPPQMAQQTMTCCECGTTWREVYKFVYAETDK